MCILHMIVTLNDNVACIAFILQVFSEDMHEVLL